VRGGRPCLFLRWRADVDPDSSCGSTQGGRPRLSCDNTRRGRPLLSGGESGLGGTGSELTAATKSSLALLNQASVSRMNRASMSLNRGRRTTPVLPQHAWRPSSPLRRGARPGGQLTAAINSHGRTTSSFSLRPVLLLDLSQ
jgi:hypothetical protein